MTSADIRVDFYVLEDDTGDARLRFACRLVEKAVRLDHRVFALAEDESLARRFDELLWTFRAESFVPHALASTPGAAGMPVTIGSDADPDAAGDLLINLTAGVPNCFESFRRVAEIVDASEHSRREGRARFSFYRDNGLEPQTHRIA